MCIYCDTILLPQIKTYNDSIQRDNHNLRKLMKDLENSKQVMVVQTELASRYLSKGNACSQVPILFQQFQAMRRKAHDLSLQVGQASHFRYWAEVQLLDDLIDKVRLIQNRTR